MTATEYDHYRINVSPGRERPIRVAQWATGSIGRTILRGILDDPGLELVALKVYGDRKAGRDAGDLARRPAAGVRATTSVDDLLAAKPDVVVHAPRLQIPYEHHDDDIIALLEAGINVVTTAGNHYLPAHDAARLERFTAAAKAGNATLFGAGISPGVIGERVIMALTSMSIEIESITMDEVLDASGVLDPDFVFNVMAMGTDPDAPAERSAHVELYGKLYLETIRFIADQMGVTIDRIEPDHRVVAGVRDLDVPAGHIAAGTVAATEWRWHAIVDGRRFFTLAIIWTMDPDLPQYRDRKHWTVDVHGRPEMHLTLDITEPPDSPVRTTGGQYATAAAALRAIPLVLDAPPGLLTPTVFAPYLDASSTYDRKAES